MEIDEAALEANANREKLKQLLALKPVAIRNTILAMYNETPNLLEPGSDVVATLGMSNIKTKRELSAALERAGVRPLSKEYNDYYDRYCTEYPNLPI